MGDRNTTPQGENLENNSIKEIEIPIENIKVEPSFDIQVYNEFMSNDSVYDYSQIAVKEDNSVTQSGFSTDSENTYTEIGVVNKPKFNKKQELLWSHFEKLGDDDCAACKYCNKMFTYQTSTRNLKAHLKRAHTSIYNDLWVKKPEPIPSTSKDCPSTSAEGEPSDIAKKTPLAWEHFIKLDYDYAVCKHCKRKLSYRATSGNLTAHLRRVHKPLLLQLQKEPEKDSHVREKEREEFISSLNNEDENNFTRFGLIWKYFDKLGDEYAMCKYCYKELSCKTTTGNLSMHLKRSHNPLYLEYRSIVTRDLNECSTFGPNESIPISGPLWDHFEQAGRFSAVCKYCSRKLSFLATSGNLSRHLRMTHPSAYVEYKSSKHNFNDSGSQNDSSVISDSDENSDAEIEDQRIQFDQWRRRGTLWDHFVKNEDFTAACKYCQKSISFKGTTGNLTGHLRRVHKSLYMSKYSEGESSNTNEIVSNCTVTVSCVEIDENEFIEKPLDTNQCIEYNVTSDMEKVCVDKFDNVAKKANSIEGANPNSFCEVLIKSELQDHDMKMVCDIQEESAMECEVEVTSNPLPKEEDVKELDSNVNEVASDIIKETQQHNIECEEVLESGTGPKKVLKPEKTNEAPVITIDTDSDDNLCLKDISEKDKLKVTNESPELLKLIRLDLIWKYFDKRARKGCVCMACDKVFFSTQEIHLVLHLKEKHEPLYRKFIFEQISETDSWEIEMHKKKNQKICKKFLYKHFTKLDLKRSRSAQCNHCPILCNYAVNSLAAHLEKNHKELYNEYLIAVRKTLRSDEAESIAIQRLKKTAVPSVFKVSYNNDQDRSAVLGLDIEGNSMTTASIYNSKDNVAISQQSTEMAINQGECRACLKCFDITKGLYDIFQPWYMAWDGMESTVAADMAKIAKIQITANDPHSNYICLVCCGKLRNACEFMATVKRNDQILRLRCTGETWPKPIMVDKSLESTTMEVDIKQEAVSEPEYENEDMEHNETSVSALSVEPVDIKIEPEEMIDQKPLQDDINDNQAGELNSESFGQLDRSQNMRENVAAQSEPMEEREPVKGRGKLIRRDFCLFCEKLVIDYPKHITKMHAHESELQPILKCPKQSVERKKLVTVLRKKGNYTYNEQLASKPKKVGANDEVDYLPCPECLGFFQRKVLWKHQKRCHNDTCTFRAQTKAQNFQLKHLDVDKRLLEEVFPSMRANKISLIAKRDRLIRAFAADYISTHKHMQYVNVTSRKMRELARVLIEIQKMDPTILSFTDALKPQNYKLFVEATKIISGYDEQTDTFVKPTLALNICTSYKQCCQIAIEEAENSGKGQSAEVVAFKALNKLFWTNWKFDITQKVTLTLTERRMLDTEPAMTWVPLAKTAKLFNDYLIQKSQFIGPQLKFSEEPQIELYTEFTEIILCRVLMWNRRRASEIQNIKLTTYDKVNSGRFYELYKANSLTEQIMMKKCKCVMAMGAKGQVLPVYFSPEIVKDINILRSLRERYFKEENPYLFGMPNTNIHIKGLRILEKQGKIYDPKKYKPLSSMRYRKHVAVLTQLFNMTWVDIHELLTLMEMSLEHNMPVDVNQVAKLCKLLLAKDDIDCQGKTIDEISLDLDDEVENLQDCERDEYEDSESENYLGDCPESKSQSSDDEVKKRVVVRWTEQQKEVVMEYFGDYIKKKILPKLHECNDLKVKYPELLHNKDWIKIKAFIQNASRKKRPY